ncbi:MAG: hypothetical protein ACI4KO_06050 [Ruminiclostridium sp.]
MPRISNIGDASISKNFSNTTLNNHKGSDQGGEQFTVSGTPKQQQLQTISDKNAGNNAQTTMGQRDLIPLAVTSTKNQTLAVETVKDIINTDLLNTARLNGYTELVGELENLSSSLYIPAQDLVKEMMEQEKQNTMFSGDRFYDLLREAAKDANDDLKEAIGNMLKAINFSSNKQEITTAVSSNLRFLAEYFSPNRSLSEQLSQLADRWGSNEPQTNFAELRGKTAELLQNLSESLLNDSHTQTLLPIVTHNLSKYNTNSSMLREYFNQLLTQISSYELRNELSGSFEGLLAKLSKNNSLNNYTISEQKNQVENSNFSNEYQTNPIISSYLTENLDDEAYLTAQGLINPDFSHYITGLHNGNLSSEDVIKNLIASLFGDNSVKNEFLQQFSSIGNPDNMVEYLNNLLDSIPEGELKNQIYDVLEEAVTNMEERNPFGGAVNAKSSSIHALTDFVERNINHPALKSIDSFNASNLLQSMINAPGVMTPLAHYILPIQVEDTRAFGELWVDNNDESGNGGSSTGKSHHLFLTFDVDTYGRFEVDVYAKDNDVSVNLLYPPSFVRNVGSVVERINRIAAATQYRITGFNTGILREPHNLTQIFPKLSERRAGLNVQA